MRVCESLRPYSNVSLTGTCPLPKRLGRLETTTIQYSKNTLPRPRASLSELRSRMVVACGVSGVAIAIVVKTLEDRVT
jgi:hypothetical protein